MINRKNFSNFSDNFLEISLEDLISFFETEYKEDANGNKLSNNDALFVKSEDTLVSAILEWVEYQTDIKSINEKLLLLEKLATYINWNDVSENVLQKFSVAYPNIELSGEYH